MNSYILTENGEIQSVEVELLKSRILFLTGEINDRLAKTLISQLLYLDSLNHTSIKLYINSPGGSVSAGLAIYDTMNFVTSPIETICIGSACSMASILLASGTKGKRFLLPNSEVMIHQPFGGMEGKAGDLEVATKHMLKTKQTLLRILHIHTKQPLRKLEKNMTLDYWMSAEEAIQYGICDEVIKKKVI